MSFQRSNDHTVSNLTAQLVWSTKYRYEFLVGDTKLRCRSIIIQICEAEGILILKGVVSKDHVHLHVSYRPSQNISDIVKKLKGRTSIKLQQEFPELGKRYWGRHFWAIVYGCWNTGNITDEMVNEYLEHHRKPDVLSDSNFIVD